MTYVPLRIQTDSSLLSSTIKPKTLIDFAINHNFPSIAITDTNNLFAAAEFCFYAAKKGYPAILGCSITTTHGIITLYCKNEHGYQNLCKLLSDSYTIWHGILPFAQLHQYSQGLAAISCGIEGVLAIQNNTQAAYTLAKTNAQTLLNIFKDDFALELNRTHGEHTSESLISQLSDELSIPIVGTSIARFITNQKAYQVIQALGEQEIISFDNKENSAETTYKLLTTDEFQKTFKNCTVLIENTLFFAQKCTFLITPTKPKFAFFADNAEQILESQVRSNFQQLTSTERWKHAVTKKFGCTTTALQIYQKRLDFELEMIINLGFTHYFLIVADFVKWAKDQKISLSARGSGGGSLVAWSLFIISIDPIIFDLFFERFINPGRVSLPDFDIDFCQDRRSEVIDYVANKYGQNMIAHIITFGLMHARGVLRDVGRVLGLRYTVVDGFCRRIPSGPNLSVSLAEVLTTDTELQTAAKSDPKYQELFDIAVELEGIKRNVSIHAAGIVIGHKPLREILPLYKTDDMKIPVTSYTLKHIEEVGLVKFDFLGLTALTIIDKTLAMINKSIDINNIPYDDPAIFILINKGLTNGIFQLETAGIRDVVLKMQTTEIEDFIAIIALFRPGPIQNISEFIARKHGKTKISYEYSALESILKPTYGIIVYQEQVLAIAKELAGYSLSEADLLRRAMGKKDPIEMDRNRTRFIQDLVARQGDSEEKAAALFDEIEKFAGYAFNKSHAACYAFIIYQNIYLKVYHSREFMAVSMTMEKHKHDKIANLASEFDALKLTLLKPCVNKSKIDFTLENINCIRYALSAIKGIGEAFLSHNITYQSVQDFCQQTKLSKRIFEILTLSGAFDDLPIYTNQSISNNDTYSEYSDMLSIHFQHIFDQLPKNISKQSYIHRNALLSEQDNLIERRGQGLFANIIHTHYSYIDMLLKEFKLTGIIFSQLPFKTHRSLTNDQSFQTIGLVVYKELIKTKQGTTQWAIKLADTQGIYEIFMRKELEETCAIKTGDILQLKNKRIRTFWIAQECKHWKRSCIIVKTDTKEQIDQLHEYLQNHIKHSTTTNNIFYDILISVQQKRLKIGEYQIHIDALQKTGLLFKIEN